MFFALVASLFGLVTSEECGSPSLFGYHLIGGTTLRYKPVELPPGASKYEVTVPNCTCGGPDMLHVGSWMTACGNTVKGSVAMKDLHGGRVTFDDDNQDGGHLLTKFHCLEHPRPERILVLPVGDYQDPQVYAAKHDDFELVFALIDSPEPLAFNSKYSIFIK